MFFLPWNDYLYFFAIISHRLRSQVNNTGQVRMSILKVKWWLHQGLFLDKVLPTLLFGCAALGQTYGACAVVCSIQSYLAQCTRWGSLRQSNYLIVSTSCCGTCCWNSGADRGEDVVCWNLVERFRIGQVFMTGRSSGNALGNHTTHSRCYKNTMHLCLACAVRSRRSWYKAVDNIQKYLCMVGVFFVRL